MADLLIELSFFTYSPKKMAAFAGCHFGDDFKKLHFNNLFGYYAVTRQNSYKVNSIRILA
jgi:hypothetical protein